MESSMQKAIVIFVDESGDLGPLGSATFTIACVSTTDPRPLERIIKRARERKLGRNKKDISELKANSSSPNIRKWILQRVGNTEDIQIDYIVVNKKQIQPHLFDAKNKLYNYVFGLLFEELSPLPKTIEIIIDRKDTNQILRQDFNQYVNRKLKEKPLNAKLTIKHLPSHYHKGLQVVDFVAWAINRKESFNEDEYFKLFESKIKTIKRLWRD